MRVLVLYSRLAPYFLHAVERFAKESSAEVTIVRKEPDPLAPFEFQPGSIALVDRESLDDRGLLHLARKLDPEVVCVSGWRDKGYLRVAFEAKGRGAASVCMADTQWTGAPRQQLAAGIGRWLLSACFSHAWVPGSRQTHYARRLGFERSSIRQGLYLADLDLFAPVAAQSKRFVFVGRLIPAKGVDLLYEACVRTKSILPDWSFHIVGSGPLARSTDHDERWIEYGFLAPQQLAELSEAGGVFVLPSVFEPWGLVVQEFAAMGYPLVLSDAVGAGDAFLADGINGRIFSSGDCDSLMRALIAIATTSESARGAMGSASTQLAETVSQTSWNTALQSFTLDRSLA